MNSVATHTSESVATSPDCSHKKDGLLRVRVPSEEMAAWKAQAAEEGKLLSEWVRESLNGVLDAEAAGIHRVFDRAAKERDRGKVVALESVVEPETKPWRPLHDPRCQCVLCAKDKPKEKQVTGTGAKRYCHHGLAFCKTCLELEAMEAR